MTDKNDTDYQNDSIETALASLSSRVISSLTEFQLDKQQQHIFDTIEKTKTNVFIHGVAGSGKSSFIQYLKNHSSKKIRIVCPTAIAALNIGGTTIHSLFQIPFSDFIIPDELNKTKRYKLASILKRTDILVIDEIPMVRPDLLDAIDYLSKMARENIYEPFGGLQLVLVGDLCQLPPVVKPNTYEICQKEYNSKNPYFFDAHSYKRAKFVKFELKKVFRQSDPELLKYLSDIRLGENVASAIDYFNSSKIYNPNILKTSLTITPYRHVADRINQNRLNDLNSPLITYECKTKGNFDITKDCPAPQNLNLKKGALVIFNKNNSDQWINGTSGIIEDLSNDIITVKLLIGGRTVYVKREEWKNFTYIIDPETNDIIEKEIGSFIQFPLQLGYAITIHKAQGKTLDKVIIDISSGAFDHGQIYVALSRTRKKSDMHIIKPLSESDIIIDKRVTDFLQNN